MYAPTAITASSSDARLLIFFGSPGEHGHTAMLLDEFLDALPASYPNIDRVNAYQRQVKPCIGCGDCTRSARCRFEDMDDIDRLLREAELLLFASPVYCGGFPSPMKALLDRFQRYYSARFSLLLRPPLPRPKRAALLTVGGSRDEGALAMEQALTRQLTVMNAAFTGHFHLSDTDNRSSLTQKEKIQLALLAGKFARLTD